MRTLLFAISAVIITALSNVSSAGPLRADHPLIGTWKITLPDGSCYEVYRFRANGTTLVTSADEVAESEFEISDRPSAHGFYKWVDKIVKDNGKKDCSGEIMEVGHVATNYIRFHPSGNMFLMCEREETDTCIGPFMRVKGGDA